MNSSERRRFDRQVDRVIDELPAEVLQMLDQVPLLVEDHPSRQLMEELDLEYRDDLCGLYSGIPLDQRSIEHSGTLPENILIFREGILSSAMDRRGRVRAADLRREIRITILHELGHHFGLSEEDLRKLGYG
ncbi:MAG: metallopeptidase family protein [Pirellulales bacterium]